MNEQLSSIFQKKIEKVRNQCKFDFIKLALFQPSIFNSDVHPVYASGNTSKRYMRIVIQTGKGLAGQVMKTGRPAFVVNVDKEIKWKDMHQYPIIMAEGLKSLGALPVFKNNQVIGVVLAGFRKTNKMTDELIEQFKNEVNQEFEFLENQEMVNG